MKDLIVLLIISPLIIIGFKNLWDIIVRRKSSCGSCTRCGTTQENCSLSTEFRKK